jgi:hypothetical protein
MKNSASESHVSFHFRSREMVTFFSSTAKNKSVQVYITFTNENISVHSETVARNVNCGFLTAVAEKCTRQYLAEYDAVQSGRSFVPLFSGSP